MKNCLSEFFECGPVDIDAVKLAAEKQFSTENISITASTIATLNKSVSVEAFQLSKPAKENSYEGVSMYVDEAGQLKHLAPNRRATGFANICGFKDVPFLGDVFISRMGPTESGQTNIDFKLSGSKLLLLYYVPILLAQYQRPNSITVAGCVAVYCTFYVGVCYF